MGKMRENRNIGEATTIDFLIDEKVLNFFFQTLFSIMTFLTKFNVFFFLFFNLFTFSIFFIAEKEKHNEGNMVNAKTVEMVLICNFR